MSGVSATPTIRRATNADVNALLDLWRRADAHPSPTDNAPAIGRMIDAPHAAVFVAVAADGVLVGSVFVTFDGWRGNFYRMAVDPTQRRQGLALRLAAAGEEWLRDAGAVRLSALVEGNSDGAHAFWDAAGFEHYLGMRRYSKNV